MQVDSRIFLAIADDHTMVRESLCTFISSLGNFQIDIQAGDGIELLDKLQQATRLPDICILDINMPRKNGWDTLYEIKNRWPSLKVLILTTLREKDIINNLAKSQADGYIPKNCDANELRNALIKLHETGVYFQESIARQLYSALRTNDKNFPNKKEIEFLSHCCEDSSYKDIAQKMSVSPRTVEGYRDSLFSKLNVRTRIGLAIYAFKSGFVSLFQD